MAFFLSLLLSFFVQTHKSSYRKHLKADFFIYLSFLQLTNLQNIILVAEKCSFLLPLLHFSFKLAKITAYRMQIYLFQAVSSFQFLDWTNITTKQFTCIELLEIKLFSILLIFFFFFKTKINLYNIMIKLGIKYMTGYHFPFIYIVLLITVDGQAFPVLFIAPEIGHNKTSYTQMLMMCEWHLVNWG